MVSILSFETKSIEYLLQEKFSMYFSSAFPMFYKNKIKKKGSSKTRDDFCGNHEQFFYKSAVDKALLSNQIGALNIIIAYIVKYQNVYSSSFLFKKNLG